MKAKSDELYALLKEALGVEKGVHDRMDAKLTPGKDVYGTIMDEAAVDRMTLTIAKQIKGDCRPGKIENLAVIIPTDGGISTATQVLKHLSHLNCSFMPATIQVSSYRGTEAGRLSIDSKLKIQVAGRDVVIVEDIVDKGKTVYLLKKYLFLLGAKSVRIACLIDKDQPREHPVRIDYPGFKVDAGSFPVGEFMDYRKMFRDKKGIWMVDRSTLPVKGSEEEKILDSIPQLNEKIYMFNRIKSTLSNFPFFAQKLLGINQASASISSDAEDTNTASLRISAL